MVSSSVLVLLFVGVISAAPVEQDDWTDIVKAGADVAGHTGKVVIDILKLIKDAGSKREVQDGWQEIAAAGGEVLGNAAKVVIDIVKIVGDVKGKREAQDDLAEVVAAIEAKVAEVVENALKVVHEIEGRREVQDANWGSLIVDGATAVGDIVDLGKSIGHLVTVIGNGK